MSSLIIVGGPNGSGKTTLTQYLIQKGRIRSQVINPDDIALNELGSYQHHVGAARIALTRRKEAIPINKTSLLKQHFQVSQKLMKQSRQRIVDTN